MGFPISALLKRRPFNTSKVAAGHKGIDNEIDGFIFLETPPQHQAVSPIITEIKLRTSLRNKIILSSMYAESQDLSEQLVTIRQIHEMGSAGLVLFHVGYLIPEVSKQMTELCDQLDFPLIVMPGTVLFSTAVAPILDLMFEEKYKKLKYAQNIYDRFSNLMLNGKGIIDIIRELSTLIGEEVIFFDHNNTCTAYSGSQAPEQATVQQIAEDIYKRHSALLDGKENILARCGEQNMLLVPIANRASFFGTMVIIGNGTVGDLGEIAVMQTKNALQLISIRRIRFQDYRAELLREFVSKIVTWRFPSNDAAVKSAANLDIPIADLHVVVVLAFCDDESPAPASAKRLDILCGMVREDLAYTSPASIAAVVGSHVVILFSGSGSAAEVCRAASSTGLCFIRNIHERKGWQISAGVGRYAAQLQDLAKSYHQAVETLQIAENIFGHANCTRYEDIPIYSLLRNIDRNDVKENQNILLAPLIEYDTQRNGELVNTLRVLLECRLSYVAASEKMYLHKNTIRQRKSKIMELLRFNPFEQPYRNQLEIAFLLGDILGEK